LGIATTGEMVDGAGECQTQRPCHERSSALASVRLQDLNLSVRNAFRSIAGVIRFMTSSLRGEHYPEHNHD
jgi:hypothetical protein